MSGLWGRLPLGAKIAFPYFVLTMLVGIGGTFVATRLAAQSANDRLTTALVEAVRGADSELLRREDERVGALLQLLERRELADAAEVRDQARLTALLEPLPLGAEWAGVLAADGATVIVRRGAGGDDRRSVPGTAALTIGGGGPVGRALQGVRDFAGDRHGGIGTLDGAPALVAAAPLRRGERVVGALVVGSDAERVTQAVKGTLLVDVALFDADGAPVANTLSTGAPRAALPRLEVAPREDELVPARFQVGEREYHALVAPLRIRGVTAGGLAAVLPADAVARIGAETRGWLTWLFGGAMVVSVMLGLAIARLIAGPVRQLGETARAIGSGDLSRRSALTGRDEIALLGRAFDGMADSLADRQERLTRAYLNTVRALAAAIDAKDPYTHGHSQRVAAYSVMAARALGVDEATIRDLEMAGLLHDVGKIGVPDGVLTKPGKLDDDEWAHIRRHPTVGAEILAPVGFNTNVMDFVLYHHERLNGRGFPEGLRGEAIPLVARVAAVADAYDAMTSNRSYRRALSHETAVEELRRGAGEQFDPACVEALIGALPGGPLPSADAARQDELARAQVAARAD